MRRALGGGVAFLLVGALAVLVGISALRSAEDIGVLGLLSGFGFLGLSAWFLHGAVRIRREQRARAGRATDTS